MYCNILHIIWYAKKNKRSELIMLTTIRFSKNNLKEVRNVRYKTLNAKVNVVSVAVLLAACFIAYMYDPYPI